MFRFTIRLQFLTRYLRRYFVHWRHWNYLWKHGTKSIYRTVYNILNRRFFIIISICYFPLFFTEIIGFNCPEKADPHSVSAKFEPYPRYALPGDPHRLITCVHGHPRLISCGEGSVVDESSLTCVEYVYNLL